MKARYQHLLLLLLLLISYSCADTLEEDIITPEEQAVRDMLSADPRLTIVKSFATDDYPEYKHIYFCHYEQPLDHRQAAAGHFQQSFMLFIRDINKPTVLYTNGYQVNDDPKSMRPTTLPHLLDANWVSVGYRYFLNSQTTPVDTTQWTYFDSRQASADLHDVVTSLKRIFPEKWVSTGGSKDGMATYTYCALYPEDMAVGVPFVAPISTSLSDYAIGDYTLYGTASRPDLPQVDDDRYRHAHDYLRQMLVRLCGGNEADDHYFFHEYLKRTTGFTSYQQLTHEQLKYYVQKFVATYGDILHCLWSYNAYMCGDYAHYFDSYEEMMSWVMQQALPEGKVTDENLVNFVFDGDGLYERLAGLPLPQKARDLTVYPYYVQAAKELGTVAYDCSFLADTRLFQHFTLDEIRRMGNQIYNSLDPDDLDQIARYDNTLMRYIKEDYLPHNSQHPIVFVYGQHDSWTGAALRESDMGPAVHRIIVEHGIHSTNTGRWREEERQRLYRILEDAGLPVVHP